jgi:hypothetical protein
MGRRQSGRLTFLGTYLKHVDVRFVFYKQQVVSFTQLSCSALQVHNDFHQISQCTCTVNCLLLSSARGDNNSPRLRDCPAWQPRASTCGSALLPHADKHMFVYVLELCKSEAKRRNTTARIRKTEAVTGVYPEPLETVDVLPAYFCGVNFYYYTSHF